MEINPDNTSTPKFTQPDLFNCTEIEAQKAKTLWKCPFCPDIYGATWGALELHCIRRHARKFLSLNPQDVEQIRGEVPAQYIETDEVLAPDYIVRDFPKVIHRRRTVHAKAKKTLPAKIRI